MKKRYTTGWIVAFATAVSFMGIAIPNGSFAQINCAGTATGNIPLNDLGAGLYLGQFEGGLYPGGANTMPETHVSVGLARGQAIQPLDVDGNPDASGKYVLLSIGMSGPSREFCQSPKGTSPCLQQSFMRQAAADPAVNHTTLAIINGAADKQYGGTWDDPTDANYERIRDELLIPNGLSELQVQVIWLKMIVKAPPRTSLPDDFADAYRLKKTLAQIIRAARIRYPNLQQLFLSSRIYGGYSRLEYPLFPEPYAYETGFGVKWVIQAQIDQMNNGGTVVDRRVGDLNYNTGIAPWIAWGPYLWADGLVSRSDGLIWECADFQPYDGIHPNYSGIEKVGRMLLDFFKTDPNTKMWFTTLE